MSDREERRSSSELHHVRSHLWKLQNISTYENKKKKKKIKKKKKNINKKKKKKKKKKNTLYKVAALLAVLELYYSYIPWGPLRKHAYSNI